MSYNRSATYGGFSRSSGAYKALQKRFKAHCRQLNSPCWICSGSLGPIDYTAAGGKGNAFEMDHITAVIKRPDLAMAWANLAASHSACNRSRGHKEMREYRRDQGQAAAESPPARWVKPSW